MKNRIVSLLLCLALLLALAPAALAADPAGAWFTGHAGTEADPYLITTAADLKELAAAVNGGNSFTGKFVSLGATIDLRDENWTPIGASGKPFHGTFDGQSGQGYKITNLNLNSTDSNLGLFGYAGGDPEHPNPIRNLTLENVSIVGGDGSQYVGALIGNAFCVTLDNCLVTGTVYVNGRQRVGGLVGGGYLTANNCAVVCSQKEEKQNIRAWYQVGGIIGMANGTITGCTVENVHILSRSGGFVGGITGQMNEGKLVSGSTLTDVTILSGTGNGTEFAGLVVGVLNEPAAYFIINSTLTGTTAAYSDNTPITTLAGTYTDPAAPRVIGDGVVMNAANTAVLSAEKLIECDARLLAPNAELVDNGDGTYSVKAYSAVLNGTKYETLQAALDAAGAGDTVELLAAVTENVTVKQDVVIDLDSFVLTADINVQNDALLTLKGAGAADVTLADAAKSGVIFDGWYTDAAFTQPVANGAFSGVPGDAGVTFYAKFKESDYVILPEDELVLDFGVMIAGGPVPPAQSVTFSLKTRAAGETTVTPGTAFDASADGLTVTVAPKAGLGAGVYEEQLVVTLPDGLPQILTAKLQELPAASAANPPQTGDNSQPMLYLALLMVGFAGMTLLGKKRRA